METEKIESTDSATIVHVKMKSFSSSVELHKIGLVNDRGLPRIFPEPKDYDKYSKISLFFPKGFENGT